MSSLVHSFFALSASYGTHAIVTRIAVRVLPAPRYVHIRYLHCDSMASATLLMERLANSNHPPEFLDGVALSDKSTMVVVGDGCDNAPPGVHCLSLRGNRYDPWFFWHVASTARKLSALTSRDVEATGADASATKMTGRSEYCTLDDYLFRFGTR
jgi:hypothetical protein